MNLKDLLEMLLHLHLDILPQVMTIKLLQTSKGMNWLVANMQRVVFVVISPRLCDYSKHVKAMINCVENNIFLCKIHITVKVFLEEHEAQHLAKALCNNTTVCCLVLRCCN
jgi:hypothetical protein